LGVPKVVTDSLSLGRLPVGGIGELDQLLITSKCRMKREKIRGSLGGENETGGLK